MKRIKLQGRCLIEQKKRLMIIKESSMSWQLYLRAPGNKLLPWNNYQILQDLSNHWTKYGNLFVLAWAIIHNFAWLPKMVVYYRILQEAMEQGLRMNADERWISTEPGGIYVTKKKIWTKNEWMNVM